VSTAAVSRPSGWKVNPQALADVSKRKPWTGHETLTAPVDKDSWLTPRYVLDFLGQFDLDPCACDLNPTWVCPRYFTLADDGLREAWHGRVFMNPPFSNIIPWILRHAQHGLGISLVPASVESRIWREVVWKQARAILLLHGRTRFCNPDGSTTTGRPLRSIALIGWGQYDRDVLGVSPLCGVLLTSWRQG
jgi:phage N-6-adenine-methyltransferase